MDLLLVLILAVISLPSTIFGSDWQKCPVFCGLTGNIPDSNCTISQIDSFNRQIHRLLLEIQKRPYFRYYKTQLNPNCSFWPPPEQCFGQGCNVDPCNDLPDQIARSWNSELKCYTHTTCQENDPLGNLDMSGHYGAEQSNECAVKRCSIENNHVCSTPTAQQELIVSINKNQFCDLPEDEQDPDSVFVDLQKNPERFTGYRGESSWRIWRAIYNENCKWPDPNLGDVRSDIESNESLTQCLENKVFYNIISGFHASINTHVCAQFYYPGNVYAQRWAPNLDEFVRRFGAIYTKGQGTQYLKNLYFLYLLELQAIVKAGPLLKSLEYPEVSESRDYNEEDSCHFHSDSNFNQIPCNGNPSNDRRTPPCVNPSQMSTRCLILNLLNTLDELKCYFDQSQMFRQTHEPYPASYEQSGEDKEDYDRDSSHSRKGNPYNQFIRDTFREKFVNITKILDCVSCDKCRMWGRLQIKAIGTVINILFNEQTLSSTTLSSNPTLSTSIPPLSRSQVVALLNGFAKCSEAIHHIDNFRTKSNEKFDHTEL